MRSVPVRVFIALFTLWVVFGTWAPPSAAQLAPSARRNPDHPTLSAEFPFHGMLWPNRWIPLNVTLVGGAKPFEGQLAIIYSQDDRLSSQILRAVTATPGKPSTFSVLVNLPPYCSELKLTLHGAPGRPIATLNFNPYPDQQKGEFLLPSVTATAPAVIAIGDPQDSLLGTARAIVDSDSDAQNDRSATGVARPNVIFLPPSQVPLAWVGLDAALVTISTSENSGALEPRALASVHEWVSSGGRLVILASGPGDAWTNWFSRTPERPLPIAIAPARDQPVPATLATTLGWQAPVSDPPPAGFTATAAPPTARLRAAEKVEPFSAASSTVARVISLTEVGMKSGWRVRHAIDGDPSAGLLAEGPFGFGWITIVGFNPDLVAATVSNDATCRVWYDVLANALGDWRSRITPQTTTQSHMPDTYNSGGFTVSDFDGQNARNMLLDQVSNVPTVSSAVFPILAVGIFLLAMLIGPVDALVLRTRRARHRSWATAIAWISLASLIAYFIPNLMRSGETIINRFTVLDASQVDASPTGLAPAWRASFTGVFAGESFEQRFSGATGGTWWRPVSSRQEFYWGRDPSNSPLRAMVTRQSTPVFAGLAPADDPWGGFLSGDASSGGNVPAAAHLKLWTFHTFQDQARVTTPLRVAVRYDRNIPPELVPSEYGVVEVEGVPEGASIHVAAVRLATPDGERWHALSFEKARDRHIARISGLRTPGPPPSWDLAHDARATRSPRGAYTTDVRVEPPNYMMPCLLPGPDRRAWVMSRAIERGDAVVYMAIRSMPLDITLDVPARTSHTQICRIIVPVVDLHADPASAEESTK